MKKLAAWLIAVLVMVLWGMTVGLVSVGIASAFFIYPPLQIYALAKWKGMWRVASLVPLIIMVPAYAQTYRGWVHHSNLGPIMMIFYSPIAVLFLVGLLVARYPNRQRIFSKHADLIEGLRELGLGAITEQQIEAALKDLYPAGHSGVSETEVLRRLFLSIKAKNSADILGR